MEQNPKCLRETGGRGRIETSPVFEKFLCQADEIDTRPLGQRARLLVCVPPPSLEVGRRGHAGTMAPAQQQLMGSRADAELELSQCHASPWD
jgi:hypothetical protein